MQKGSRAPPSVIKTSMHTLSSVYELWVVPKATPPHLGTITCSQILPKTQLLFGVHTSVAPWRILILRHWTKNDY